MIDCCVSDKVGILGVFHSLVIISFAAWSIWIVMIVIVLDLKGSSSVPMWSKAILGSGLITLCVTSVISLNILFQYDMRDLQDHIICVREPWSPHWCQQRGEVLG